MVKNLRINERVMAREVRLVGDKGEQLGIMPTPRALDVAHQKNLDLVEVAPTAVPPVCRLIDYGKYKYEQAKKERETRRNQRVPVLREVRLRPRIDNHDFEAKARLAKKLIDEGDKVKVTVLFRGREIVHAERGLKLLKRMAEAVMETTTIERQPAMDGRRMIMILAPLAGQKAKPKEGVKESKNA